MREKKMEIASWFLSNNDITGGICSPVINAYGS